MSESIAGVVGVIIGLMAVLIIGLTIVRNFEP